MRSSLPPRPRCWPAARPVDGKVKVKQATSLAGPVALGGEIIHTYLSSKDEAKLKAAFGAHDGAEA
jgi:uncharacterized membrane protein